MRLLIVRASEARMKTTANLNTLTFKTHHQTNIGMFIFLFLFSVFNNSFYQYLLNDTLLGWANINLVKVHLIAELDRRFLSVQLFFEVVI